MWRRGLLGTALLLAAGAALAAEPGAGKSVEVRNPAAHKLIQSAVEKELDSKGMPPPAPQ
jgi:hypothetical protein